MTIGGNKCIGEFLSVLMLLVLLSFLSCECFTAKLCEEAYVTFFKLRQDAGFHQFRVGVVRGSKEHIGSSYIRIRNFF